MKGLKQEQVSRHICLLCGESSEDLRTATTHAKKGVHTPKYHIGDRVAFQMTSSGGGGIQQGGGFCTSSYTVRDYEGTIINLLMDKSWLTKNPFSLDVDHDERYLYGYQIRTDNGHIYELESGDEAVRSLKVASQKSTYDSGKKVFSPDEFREEMKRDPRWKTFVTPRSG